MPVTQVGGMCLVMLVLGLLCVKQVREILLCLYWVSCMTRVHGLCENKGEWGWGWVRMRVSDDKDEWWWGWVMIRVSDEEGEWGWGWVMMRVSDDEGEWGWGWVIMRVSEDEGERWWGWIIPYIGYTICAAGKGMVLKPFTLGWGLAIR